MTVAKPRASLFLLAAVTAAIALCFALVLPAAGFGEATYPRTGMRLLTEGNVSDWSPDGSLLAMSKMNGAGLFETFLIRPDGSVVANLNTEPAANAPPANCDRGNAHFHPSGRYLVMSVANPEAGCPNRYADPGVGAWTNLWAYDLVGKRWTNLTNYSRAAEGGLVGIYGTLFPNFSRNGTKLVWSKLLGIAEPLLAIFGRWELHVATFSDVGGPHLEADTTYTFGGASFYEPFGFTADDSQILLASNPGKPIGALTLLGLDIYLFNPATGATQNWTDSALEYDEHARLSPDGTKVAWGCCGDVRIRDLARTTSRQRVTYFGSLFHQESSLLTFGWVMAWSPDGKQLAVVEHFIPDGARNRTWIVTM